MTNEISTIQTSEPKEGIMQNIVTEESIEALSSAIDVVKKEYGNFKLSKEMRLELAKELGESEEYADGWQTIVDILDHIDINELAKKHPEKIGKVSKAVVGIIACLYPAASFATNVPEDFLAKMVEFAGILTPEHLVNIFARKQIEKNKAKRAHAQTADAEEQPSKTSKFKDKLTSGYKNTTGKISGLFTKKGSPPSLPQGEDIFVSLRRLSELKDSGIITQEEFDAKKAELLEKL